MRISDWSSDVCSSDLALLTFIRNVGEEGLFPKDYDPQELQAAIDSGNQIQLDKVATDAFLLLATHLRDGRTPNAARKQWFMTDSDSDSTRSEERRVGKESVSTCRSRGSPYQ